MTTSIRQISCSSSAFCYPTLKDLQTQQFLLTTEMIDEVFDLEHADAFLMCKHAIEIRQTIGQMVCQIGQCRRYTLRFASIIQSIFNQFGVGPYVSKLFGCISTCIVKWKKALKNNLVEVNDKCSIERVFVYRTERNTYLLSILKILNTGINRTLGKLKLRNSLNANVKKYLKSKGILQDYWGVYRKVSLILQEKEEETHLKLLLINEFCQYTIHYFQLCTTQKEEENVFKSFCSIASSMCRVIQKFYSIKLVSHIEESLEILKNGLEILIYQFSTKGLKNRIKIEHLYSILMILNQEFYGKDRYYRNQNAFVVRLLLKILLNWKKISIKSNKIRCISNNDSSNEFFKDELVKNQQKNTFQRTFSRTSKASEFKQDSVKINRSLSQLNRRKSQLKYIHPINQKPHSKTNALESVNTKIIRNEIEGSLCHLFRRVNSLKQMNFCPIEEKRSSSGKKIGEELKQLRLDDFVTEYNNRKKKIETKKKIQLYQAEKMYHFCKNKSKVRLQLK